MTNNPNGLQIKIKIEREQNSKFGTQPLRWDATDDFWTLPIKTRWRTRKFAAESSMQLVKKRKFWLYGHISRSSGTAKTVLQGKVKGARRRGRQKKRQEDNTNEWTGWSLEIPWGQRKTEKDGNVLLQRHLRCPTTVKVKGLRWDGTMTLFQPLP